jgi:small neutral amino acid transporter SnatA (MarC family)
MDDQQHVISGLLYIADALEDEARREPAPLSGDDRAPAPDLVEPESDKRVAYHLLATVAFILVLNPLGAAALAAGVGTSGANLSYLGRFEWLASSALLVVTAILADPLLDLVNISLPSWQVAAGTLLIVAVLRLFVQRDPFTPPLGGNFAREWVAVLWLTFWVATPAALGVAIAYALDLNRWAVLVAIVLATALASLGAALGPALRDRLGRTRLRELARWTSLLALIPAAKLILDGLNGV